MSNIQQVRRIPNANGQILIENWVEERATEHLDHRIEEQTKNQPSSSTSTKKTAHTALLTQDFEAPLGNHTIYRQSYDEFGPFSKKEQGARRKLLEHNLTRQVAAEFNARKREHDENLHRECVDDSTSEYRRHYRKEFESKPPPATQVNIFIRIGIYEILHF